MTNPVDIVVVTIGTADNVQSIANSPNPGNIAWAGTQAAINSAPLITRVPVQVVGISQLGAMLTIMKMQVDMIEGRSPALGDVITVVGAGITLVAAVAAVGTVAAPAVALVGLANLVVAASAL